LVNVGIFFETERTVFIKSQSKAILAKRKCQMFINSSVIFFELTTNLQTVPVRRTSNKSFQPFSTNGIGALHLFDVRGAAHRFRL